mgnify:CR=1 FL=1|jgi:hypothetical protein
MNEHNHDFEFVKLILVVGAMIFLIILFFKI